jgi:hypothetical protein
MGLENNLAHWDMTLDSNNPKRKLQDTTEGEAQHLNFLVPL